MQAGIVAWFNFTSGHPVVKPRGVDTVGFTGPRNNALRATKRIVAIQQNNKKNSVNQNF
ncbi:hypothetical protein REIS_0594 [Rickettsia endosymbiont of Ixodes scapularis]|nr:hypothetical protein REIS_0594 [Rickettsia endosymbiont of Ixodes scapularis]